MMIDNIDKKLVEELRKVDNDNSFVAGVMNKLETYDEKERMYGFFFCGRRVTPQAVVILSTLIAKERQDKGKRIS